jgi:flagellar basal-body rod modification protein FlgD
MEVTGTNNAQSSVNYVNSNETGFGSLSTEDFLKLLMTQLENQDPTAPVSNEDLLNQVSMLSSLQSNMELSDAIETLAGAQGLSTAAAYIGKTISGTNTDREHITGPVDRAYVSDGKTYLGIGKHSVSLNNLQSVEITTEDAA